MLIAVPRLRKKLHGSRSFLRIKSGGKNIKLRSDFSELKGSLCLAMRVCVAPKFVVPD